MKSMFNEMINLYFILVQQNIALGINLFEEEAAENNCC
jgi:hypothetical protein